jgi:hypothetical protein
MEQWFARQDKAVERAYRALHRRGKTIRPEKVHSLPVCDGQEFKALPTSARIHIMRLRHSALEISCRKLASMIDKAQKIEDEATGAPTGKPGVSE